MQNCRKKNPITPLSNAGKMMATAWLCLALLGCGQNQNAAMNARDADIAAKEKADREQAARKNEAALAVFSPDELRKLASNAYREQRLYAPAGNNAVEYYLAIRKKSPKPDPLTESALMDLTPYTVIAAEQAIARLDFNEASRLRDLIATVDSNAPAIPRITQAIADGMKNADALASAESRREQEALLANDALAGKKTEVETIPAIAKPAVSEIPAKPVAGTPALATVPTPGPANLPVLETPVPASMVGHRAASEPMAVARKTELVAIRTPDPDYPSEALDKGLSGAVEIEFIVQRSGEVSAVRVVNSSQRAFDRNVMSTVKRWRFAPMDEPMTVRRSFNFNNPG